MTPSLPRFAPVSRSPHFPRVILGTAALGGLRGTIDREEAVLTILEALESGITLIDTAPAYGNAEELVGAALSRWRGPAPSVSTKVGKLWIEGRSFHDYDPAALQRSLTQSLNRLGLPSVHCLFLHEPDHLPPPHRNAALRFLGACQQAGHTRLLGLGGGHGCNWDGLVETGLFAAAILHGRLDAISAQAWPEDVPRLQRAGVAVLAGSILHKGLLGDRTAVYLRRQPAWLTPAAAAASARFHALAAQAGIEPAALAHRYVWSRPEVHALAIGPENRSQLHATLAALRCGPLPAELLAAVAALPR